MLPCYSGTNASSSGAKALARLKKKKEEEEEEEEQNRVLPGCRFTTLAKLSVDLRGLNGSGKAQKERLGARKRATVALSRVIAV